MLDNPEATDPGAQADALTRRTSPHRVNPSSHHQPQPEQPTSPEQLVNDEKQAFINQCVQPELKTINTQETRTLPKRQELIEKLKQGPNGETIKGDTAEALTELDKARSRLGYMQAAYGQLYDQVYDFHPVLGHDPNQQSGPQQEILTQANADQQLPLYMAKAGLGPQQEAARWAQVRTKSGAWLSDDEQQKVHRRMSDEYEKVQDWLRRECGAEVPICPGSMSPDRQAEVATEQRERMGKARDLIGQMTANPAMEQQLAEHPLLAEDESTNDKYARYMALWAMPYWRQAGRDPGNQELKNHAWGEAQWAMGQASWRVSDALAGRDRLYALAGTKLYDESLARITKWDPLKSRTPNQASGVARA